MSIFQRLFPKKATSSHIPTKILQDVRVIIPESISESQRDGYLDFDLNPLELEEVQRTGLFLLEHLAAALESFNDLQKLERTYETERTSHRMTRKELEALGSGYAELVDERDSLKERWRAATIELKQAQAQIESLKSAAEYDKEFTAALEQQIEQAKLDLDVRNEYD